MKTKKNSEQYSYSKKRRSGWYKVGQTVLWMLTAVSILGLLGACFGGDFNPAHIKGISVIELMMPFWIVLWLIVGIMDFLWCRKAFVFCILTFIACANAIWDYCPLNIFGPSEKKYADCPKFSLLTYNVASFHILDGDKDVEVNPTVSYIIKKNADIVCLQETEVTLSAPFKKFHITREQIDSIDSLYPYRLLYGGYLTVLSKYPIESIHTPPIGKDPKRRWCIYPIGVFRVNIEGLPVTLFNVHLQSYELNSTDKTLYKNIAKGTEISEAAEGSMKKSFAELKQILHKIHEAAVKRTEQVDALCRYIEKFGGPNVIIAGDFNDVPGCYTIHRLEGYDMEQVYPEVGFGPMITYNADMFYFRIDHVLYRGNLTPLSMSRGNIKSSDHYPLFTTFAITSESNQNK